MAEGGNTLKKGIDRQPKGNWQTTDLVKYYSKLVVHAIEKMGEDMRMKWKAS